MRKTLIAAAILATSFSTAVMAQAVGISSTPQTSVTIDLSGTLEKRCEIATSVTSVTGLDLESTAVQAGGDLKVTCNYSGAPDVELTSLNLGKLKNNTPDVDAAIAYEFVLDSLNYNLATAQTVEFPTVVTAAELTPTVKSFGVQLTETAVIAGEYVDTVTATVTPN